MSRSMTWRRLAGQPDTVGATPLNLEHADVRAGYEGRIRALEFVIANLRRLLAEREGS